MTAAGTSTVQCAAGASTLPDLEAALRAAIAEARAGLTGDGGIDLALVFISAAYGPAIRPVMDGLSDLLPACALLGTTAEGVLANGAERERPRRGRVAGPAAGGDDPAVRAPVWADAGRRDVSRLATRARGELAGGGRRAPARRPVFLCGRCPDRTARGGSVRRADPRRHGERRRCSRQQHARRRLDLLRLGAPSPSSSGAACASARSSRRAVGRSAGRSSSHGPMPT